MKFKNESHVFQFTLNDTFFLLKEQSLYEHGSINVLCTASKQESTVQLDIVLKGLINAECERCLDPIELPVDSEFSTVYKLTLNKDKFGEENYLSVNDQVVNIYDMLYENIVLSMPNRLICENAVKPKECIIELEMNPKPETDPRWNELKKLKK
jgi:uncharacterized metal-binding protein YceD (DUF177 family)